MNAIEQSDNELIYMIRCGSKEAFDLLSYKYEKIIFYGQKYFIMAIGKYIVCIWSQYEYEQYSKSRT